MLSELYFLTLLHWVNIFRPKVAAQVTQELSDKFVFGFDYLHIYTNSYHVYLKTAGPDLICMSDQSVIIRISANTTEACFVFLSSGGT